MEEVRKPCSPIKWESWLVLKRLTLEETKRTGKQITTSQIMERAIEVLDNQNKRKERVK